MKYIKHLVLAGCVTAGLSATAQVDWSQLPPAATQSGVTFTNDIQPLFKASCVRCHGAERPRAQLRLDTLEGVLKGAKNGPVLTAGDSANSLIVKAISQLDPKTAMPPKRGPRGPRGPGGPDAPPPGANPPDMQPHDGGPMAGGPDGPPPGGPQPQGTNAPGMRPRNFGPPPKPLTAEQVGLVRAWIDQGAK
jgi:hypothetical protein